MNSPKRTTTKAKRPKACRCTHHGNNCPNCFRQMHVQTRTHPTSAPMEYVEYLVPSTESSMSSMSSSSSSSEGEYTDDVSMLDADVLRSMASVMDASHGHGYMSDYACDYAPMPYPMMTPQPLPPPSQHYVYMCPHAYHQHQHHQQHQFQCYGANNSSHHCCQHSATASNSSNNYVVEEPSSDTEESAAPTRNTIRASNENSQIKIEEMPD